TWNLAPWAPTLGPIRPSTGPAPPAAWEEGSAGPPHTQPSPADTLPPESPESTPGSSWLVVCSCQRRSSLHGLSPVLQQLGDNLKIVEHGPIPWTDDFLSEDALLVNDVGLGDSHELVSLVGLSPRIDQDGEGQIQRLDEGGDILLRGHAVNADRQNDQAVLFKILVEDFHGRHFFSTGFAPGRPEIQEHDLPSEIRETNVFLVQIRKREVGCHLAHREGLVFGTLHPHDAEHQRQNCNRHQHDHELRLHPRGCLFNGRCHRLLSHTYYSS